MATDDDDRSLPLIEEFPRPQLMASTRVPHSYYVCDRIDSFTRTEPEFSAQTDTIISNEEFIGDIKEFSKPNTHDISKSQELTRSYLAKYFPMTYLVLMSAMTICALFGVIDIEKFEKINNSFSTMTTIIAAIMGYYFAKGNVIK